MKTRILSTILLGCCTLASAAPTKPAQSPWERSYFEHHFGELAWNKSRTIAVAYFAVGEDFQRTYFWCFRKTSAGKMELFACFITDTDFLFPIEPKVSDEGLHIVLANGEVRYPHFFNFADKQGIVQFHKDKGKNFKFEDLPLYRELMQFNESSN